MATHHGKDGTVKVGANAVAEIDSWSVKEGAKVADDTAMGDTWETHIAGKTINSWNGQLSCHWDETDTQGQQALVAGASVTLNLYPEGAGSGATYKTGLASITDVSMDVRKDGVVSRSFTFQGNGVLTETTVA
ncbi:MAG: hypothetical protein EPO23_03255 [Xanthobacteraceae bacterium]|nr:MAG: hypothetical protein EPO23_03255 [Xanthobacteraceae bacterium]